MSMCPNPLQDEIGEEWSVLCSDGRERLFRRHVKPDFSVGQKQLTVNGWVKVKRYQVSGRAIWTRDGWKFVSTGKYADSLPLWSYKGDPVEHWGDTPMEIARNRGGLTDEEREALVIAQHLTRPASKPLTEEDIQGLVD